MHLGITTNTPFLLWLLSSEMSCLRFLSENFQFLEVKFSTRRFVVCLSMCHFVLVFFSFFSIAITSLGEERANLSAFRTFVRFVLV